MTNKNENMRLITDVSELVKGRAYWLVDKVDHKARISVCHSGSCESEADRLYFEGRMWAMPDNNQAQERWEIYGPVPVVKEPDFEAIKKAGPEGIAAEATVEELGYYIQSVDGNTGVSPFVLAEYIIGWLNGKGSITICELQSMSVLQEPKYGIRNNRLFNRGSSEFVPDDEPIFILRAHDKLAILAMLHYSSLCARSMDTNHVLAIHSRVKEFEKFAREHPDRMKQPDTVSQHYMDAEYA